MALEVFPHPTEHLEKRGVHCTAVPVQGPGSAPVLGLRALAKLVRVSVGADTDVPRACHTGKEGIILKDPPFHLLWASCSHLFSALCFQWWLKCNLLHDWQTFKLLGKPWALFWKALKEKRLCAPWMQGCWTAGNPRLLHSKGWVNKWE